MGDKYIIELEDKPFHKEDGDFLYRVKGFNSLVFDMTGIGKLTPYTEPDLEQVRIEAYEDGYKTAKIQCNIQAEKDLREVGERHYQKGLSDAWEAARRIVNLKVYERIRLFNGNTYWTIIDNHTASEAIEKLKAYEQEQDEIQISAEPIPVEDLTPYTEPDLEQMKEAFEKGYGVALDDLWKAMQKAIKMYCEIDNEVFLRVFHDVKCDWGESVLQALFKNTPQHLIDSIRQYEQKQEMDGLRQNIQTIVDQCGYTLDEIAAVLEKMREGREQ